MRRAQKVTSAVALVSLLLAGCGGTPNEQPHDLAGTSTGGPPVGGCRPALTEHDPHPVDVGDGSHHPALADTRLGETVVGPVIAEHTDVLAGVWSDHEAGELVVMVPGTEGMRVFERLRQAAPEPERVVCMEATYTHDELRLLQNELDERLVAAGGPLPLGSNIDRWRNRIDVDFESESDVAAAAEVLGDLADDEGVHLTVAEEHARR